MKHIILLLLTTCLLGLGASAQHPPKPEKACVNVAELVSDLSAYQKRKLENIYSESHARVEKIRAEQRALRDSMSVYMNLEGDQSRLLDPLFTREGQLQAALSREMYHTKVQIDAILTKEQRAELSKLLEKQRKQTRPDRPSVKPRKK